MEMSFGLKPQHPSAIQHGHLSRGIPLLLGSKRVPCPVTCLFSDCACPRQEHTEELDKKGLHDPDNHDAVITHLEPDTLEWEVKWDLGSITMNKASRGDRIPVELFQILKDSAVKGANMPTNLENSAVATGLEKVSFHSNPKERQCQRMLKLPNNCAHHMLVK